MIAKIKIKQCQSFWKDRWLRFLWLYCYFVLLLCHSNYGWIIPENHLGRYKLCYLDLSFGTFSCDLLIISVYCH
ncbi:hypothetical protein MtrunA17_Chr1g0166801 [Medicago truncatula]|nr:hypothetical protein MtrunA17_Chr1g0166801 [Medicago truncatula]